MDDDDDAQQCAHCGARVPIEDLHDHGEDFDLRAKCSAEFTEFVANCQHFFTQYWVMDEYGWEGRVCCRCGAFVDRDLAMTWAPLICDGFVDLEVGT
jgi:hypothetical protein